MDVFLYMRQFSINIITSCTEIDVAVNFKVRQQFKI